MKISDQIKREAETIINIVNLYNPNERDLAQYKGCVRRLKELGEYFAIDYDTLMTINEC